MDLESITCEKCGEPMKKVPAGTSKRTLRPYNAFWSCTNRDCGATINSSKAEQSSGPQIPPETPAISNPERVDQSILELLVALDKKVDNILSLLTPKTDGESEIPRVREKEPTEDPRYPDETPSDSRPF